MVFSGLMMWTVLRSLVAVVSTLGGWGFGNSYFRSRIGGGEGVEVVAGRSSRWTLESLVRDCGVLAMSIWGTVQFIRSIMFGEDEGQSARLAGVADTTGSQACESVGVCCVGSISVINDSLIEMRVKVVAWEWIRVPEEER